MKKSFSPRMLSPCFLLLILSGCTEFSEGLGFGRNPPDEFAVVDRAPLSIPPEFNLRPPLPGAQRPQESSSRDLALSRLADIDSQEDNDKKQPATDGDKALLKAAGASEKNANIRAIIDREATEKVTTSDHLINRVLWWREEESKTPVIDPEKEATRIETAKTKGESLTKNGSAIIEKSKSKILDF